MDERELIARLEYFRERTEQDLALIKSRLEKLWDFRILLLGVSITTSVLCSLAISLASIYYGVK